MTAPADGTSAVTASAGRDRSIRPGLVVPVENDMAVGLCRHGQVAGREEAVVATLPPLEINDETV